MPRAEWSSAENLALLDYLESHKKLFETSEARRLHGYPKAADFLSRKFMRDPPLLPRQVNKKFSNLFTRHMKSGYSFEQFFEFGKLTLNLPSLDFDDAGDGLQHPSQNEQPEQSICSESSHTSISTLQPQSVENMRENFPLACNRRDLPSRQITPLKPSAAASETQLDKGLFGKTLLGPTDVQVREIMTDISKVVQSIVRSYENTGFGEVPPDLRRIEKYHPNLDSLAKLAFAVQPQDSLFEATGGLPTKSPSSRELLRSLIGAAVYNWALDSDFPTFAGVQDENLRQYQRLVRQKFGVATDLELRQTFLKGLMDAPNFQQQTLPYQAKEMAKDLIGALSPLLEVIPESGNFHYPSNWNIHQAEVCYLFEKALWLSCQLKLNLFDRHCFFWPAPGDDFDAKSMALDRPLVKDDMTAKVRITLLPGLVASSADEFANQQGEVPLGSECFYRHEDSNVIAQALILV